MGRTPCCDKKGLKKGPWTPEEDHKLISYIQMHGPGNWRTTPKNAGLQRCGKSCRLRWTNYLRPDIKRGRFSFEEEETIIQLHSVLGNKWSAIAARLPGRTDNEIKNYWNTHIRKRLLRNGIDPVTHEPRLDLLDLSSLISSALCNQSLLNLSSLLGTQALLNPEVLRLANTLQTLKQENPETILQQLQENQLYSSILQNQVPLSQLISNSNQFLQNPVQEIPSSGQAQEVKSNLEGFSSSTTNVIGCQENLMPSNLVNPQPEFVYGNDVNAASTIPEIANQKYGSMFQSMNYNGLGVDSVISKPTSSPDPLNSSPTFVNSSSTTEVDEKESYCSSLFKFEIQESLDIEDFM